MRFWLLTRHKKIAKPSNSFTMKQPTIDELYRRALCGAIILMSAASRGVSAVPCCVGEPSHYCWEPVPTLTQEPCLAVRGCYWAWREGFECLGTPMLCGQFKNQVLCENQGCTWKEDVAECPSPVRFLSAERYFEEEPIVIGPGMADSHRVLMTVADIDGDGEPDLVTGCDPTYADEPALMMALHNTSTSFEAPQTLSSEPQDRFGRVFAIDVGDLNGDGTTDIVVALTQNHGWELNDSCISQQQWCNVVDGPFE